MKALIVRSKMKFVSVFIPKLQLFLHVSLKTTIEYVGTGDKIVHFKQVFCGEISQQISPQKVEYKQVGFFSFLNALVAY